MLGHGDHATARKVFLQGGNHQNMSRSFFDDDGGNSNDCGLPAKRASRMNSIVNLFDKSADLRIDVAVSCSLQTLEIIVWVIRAARFDRSEGSSCDFFVEKQNFLRFAIYLKRLIYIGSWRALFIIEAALKSGHKRRISVSISCSCEIFHLRAEGLLYFMGEFLQNFIFQGNEFIFWERTDRTGFVFHFLTFEMIRQVQIFGAILSIIAFGFSSPLGFRN